MIAALFVASRGCYFGLPDVDPWDEPRDARRYDGPHAVIAHPPCARWGRYWHGGPSAKTRMVKGDDGGCFASALTSVRRFGGSIRHVANGGGFHTAEERRRAVKPPKGMSAAQRAARRRWLADHERATGRAYCVAECMSKRERLATPVPFRDLLLSIARTARPAREVA